MHTTFVIFAQTLCLDAMFVLLPQSLRLPQRSSPLPISCRLEPHVHLRSSLPSAVPRRVSTSTIFHLFLFSFFSRRSPLALVTIIGSIAPPRRSLPISLLGLVPSLRRSLFCSRFPNLVFHMFFCCFRRRCLCRLSVYCLF